MRNFTDVDDKINARAAESGRPIGEITAETAQWFLDDMAAVGALEPNAMPRATQYIGQMIEMIAELIARDHAYEAEGHVLFAVESYREYGALSGRSVEDMIAGARVEVAPYKRNPMDFVLWKPSSDDLPGWDSPWGRGRPGWHIECSAMAHDLLGARFDIHGGGIDLQFPHHENEIAQSRCAGHGFANVWMHNEMLQVEGKKMSKSLGNFFTVRDLLDKGVPGEVVRMVMLSTHYRKPMDWTEEKRAQAKHRLTRWYRATQSVDAAPTLDSKVVEPLLEDLNTVGFLKNLNDLFATGRFDQLKAGMDFIGFTGESAEILIEEAKRMLFEAVDATGLLHDQAENADPKVKIGALLRRWQTLREAKDWAAADELKSRLEEAGLKLSASKDGPNAEATEAFDPAKLEALK